MREQETDLPFREMHYSWGRPEELSKRTQQHIQEYGGNAVYPMTLSDILLHSGDEKEYRALRTIFEYASQETISRKDYPLVSNKTVTADKSIYDTVDPLRIVSSTIEKEDLSESYALLFLKTDIASEKQYRTARSILLEVVNQMLDTMQYQPLRDPIE